jgi:hypothetical protein
MPASLIEEQYGMSAWRHFGRDFGKVQAHCLDVAGWQDKRGTLSLGGTDGAEDVGRRRTLISWC